MPRVKIKDREWYKRWKAESPEFFVKLQIIGGKLSALGVLLSLFPPTTPVGLAVTGIGTTMFTVSKFTKKDSGYTKEEIEQLKIELESLKSKLN